MKKRMRIRSALVLILVCAMLFTTAFINIAASSEFGPPESIGITDGNTGGENSDQTEDNERPNGSVEELGDGIGGLFETDPKYNLTGSVTYVENDNTPQGISGILIKVYSDSGLVKEIYTGSDGKFQISDLASGNYEIQYIDRNHVVDLTQYLIPSSASGCTVDIPAEEDKVEYFAYIKNVNISAASNLDFILTKKNEENISDVTEEEILENNTNSSEEETAENNTNSSEEETAENNINSSEEEILENNTNNSEEETAENNTNGSEEEILENNTNSSEEETADNNTNSSEEETAENNTNGPNEETPENDGMPDAEQEDDSQETSSAEENKTIAEEVPDATMTYEDDCVKMIVSAMEEGAISEESTLRVIPIIEEDGETAEQYAQVQQKLQEKAAEEEYDIAGFLAYDISFIDAEGNKTEPSGEVRVTMDYKQAAVPQAIDEETAAQADVTMMHLEEDANGQVTQVVDLGQNRQLTVVETTDANEVQKTEFVTNSFSTYTVTWTVDSKEKVEALTTVETLNHISAGITMRMIDYESPANGISISGSYGNGTIKKHLLESVLNGNGYPNVAKNGSSLESLFSGGTTANYLFRKDIYDATGYYEYSSFDNYAYFDTGSGNFTVYNQIGTPSNEDKYFYKRGNFMPYNQIEAGKYSTNTNLYDQYGNALAEGSARYNEKLYKTQGTNNFYFGMYMGATFAQPKDGQAVHNGYKSPMRYEFNGDDDLWVYIDNVLVLDIGGIHDAHSGYIDFSTGVVGWTDCITGGTPDTSTTTIKAMFQAAGKFPDGTAWDDSKISEYFDGDTFKDYTTHTFKMFYMERGAGASNLYMRMNLPIIPEGAVEVTKELTNTDKEKYANVKFAFQLYAQEILSTSATGQETYSETNYITLNHATYKGTNESVQFSTETFGENLYENVFFLKPDETVRFTGLKANRKYYVKEVGVNAQEYDRIIINGVEYKSFNEDQIENAVIDNIETPEDEVANRAFVVCQNNCSVYNSRELRITKTMSGTTTDRFTFKVWLENQAGTLEPYVGPYYLKDASGNYYAYDNNVLTNKGDTAVVCGNTTSEGLIQNVPAGYTATITQILSGTDFKVEEVLDTGKYQQYDKVVTKESCDTAGIEGADGAIALGKDAEMTITNYPYYKISVTKNWAKVASNPDAEVYVGLYNQDGVPVEGKYALLNSENDFQASFGQLTSGDYSVKELKQVEDTGDFHINGVEYSKIEFGESISYADEEYTVSYGEMTPDPNNYANISVTITNTLCDKAKVRVAKIWSDMADDESNHTSDQVYVGLYTVEGNTESPTDKTLILDSSNEWAGTFSNLDKTKTYTIKELVETENGAFTIGEKTYSPTETAYTANGNRYKVTYAENPDHTDTENVHSFQIHNIRLAKLNIHKMNDSGASLSGAEFKLQKDGNDVNKSDGSVYTVTTDTNGCAEFVDLEEGTYTIVETKAPVGYALPEAAQTITLAYSVTDSEDSSVSVVEGSGVKRGDSTVYYEVTKTITNYMLYELPESGGSGIFWYLVGGVLLMMAALLIKYKRS